MVPYERNQIFVGRDTFLQKLHAQFEVTTSAARYHGRVALFGLGGIGKCKPLLNSFIVLEPLTAEFIGSQQSRRSPCWMDMKKLRNERKLTSSKVQRELLLLNKYCCGSKRVRIGSLWWITLMTSTSSQCTTWTSQISSTSYYLNQVLDSIL